MLVLRFFYPFVDEYNDEEDDGETVDGAVSGDGVPMEGDFASSKYTTDRDDPENVKDGAAHDGADPQVGFCDKGSHNVGEKLW